MTAHSGAGAWTPVIVAAASATTVAALGALATDIGPWYASLAQPSWKPPDIAFGPIWTLVFTLTAASGVIAWRRAPDAAWRRRIILLFAANGVLNVLWSVLYFTLHRPDWALVEVVFLWLSVLALVLSLRPISRLASRLLWPYLAWVGIAAVLNLETVRLNGPFGGA
jgi:tryptophan-rich sensory protein